LPPPPNFPPHRGGGGPRVYLSMVTRHCSRQGLNSEARDWRIAYKQPFLATSQEYAKQESSISRQRQPNSERHTRTVNLPLLPAENCHDAYGHQKSSSENSHGPETSFSLNRQAQSLRPAHMEFWKDRRIQVKLTGAHTVVFSCDTFSCFLCTAKLPETLDTTFWSRSTVFTHQQSVAAVLRSCAVRSESKGPGTVQLLV
jgi:hypothetical protein